MEDNKQLNWYYEMDGRQIGPVSEDEIETCVKAGCLSYGDMVWQKGSPVWIKLESSSLRNLLTSPPPLLTSPPPLASPSHSTYRPHSTSPPSSHYKTFKQRFVYVILGLFLGGFGVHNFYAGYVGRGIVQLLITLSVGWLGGPMIAIGTWVLVEICAVTKDANGNKLV